MTCILTIVMAGCATPGDSKWAMEDIIKACETGAAKEGFSAIATCVVAGYQEYGRNPNSASVQEFYRYVEVIYKANRNKEIDDSTARLYMWRAYRQTVEAQNIQEEIRRSERSSMALQQGLGVLNNLQQNNNRGYAPSYSSGGRCFFQNEYTSGLTKVCNYSCSGSAYATTIGSASICPSTVSR